jgi:hypothetical protein
MGLRTNVQSGDQLVGVAGVAISTLQLDRRCVGSQDSVQPVQVLSRLRMPRTEHPMLTQARDVQPETLEAGRRNQGRTIKESARRILIASFFELEVISS